MNVYLITFTSNNNSINRIDLQNYFDTRVEVLNWFGVMPQAILVATNSSNYDITKMIADRFGNNISFLTTKAESNLTNGFINNEVWDFINNPKPAVRSGLQGLLGKKL